jgi:hypothetical protein
MKYLSIGVLYEFIVFKTHIMLENHEYYLVLKEKCMAKHFEYTCQLFRYFNNQKLACQKHNWLPLFFWRYTEKDMFACTSYFILRIYFIHVWGEIRRSWVKYLKRNVVFVCFNSLVSNVERNIETKGTSILCMWLLSKFHWSFHCGEIVYLLFAVVSLRSALKAIRLRIAQEE